MSHRRWALTTLSIIVNWFIWLILRNGKLKIYRWSCSPHSECIVFFINWKFLTVFRANGSYLADIFLQQNNGVLLESKAFKQSIYSESEKPTFSYLKKSCLAALYTLQSFFLLWLSASWVQVHPFNPFCRFASVWPHRSRLMFIWSILNKSI